MGTFLPIINTFTEIKITSQGTMEVTSDPRTVVCFIYSWNLEAIGTTFSYDINTAIFIISRIIQNNYL